MGARVETTINIWREGDEYVAQAMPVNVMSSGPTPDAARAAVAEALHLFLLTAREEYSDRSSSPVETRTTSGGIANRPG